MSAQSLNSSTYSGFYLAAIGGVPGGFPMRNASDYTTFLKQSKLFNAQSNPVVKGNDSLLDYQFGKIHSCTGCSGGFPHDLTFGS